MTYTGAHASALLLGCLLVSPFQATCAQELPTTVVIGKETVRLPGNEKLGLLGVQYLFNAGERWRLGPAAYGAASGARGGLFVWGVEAQRWWPMGERWSLAAGGFIGGGGGAAAPVGGGLMLRPHLDLWHRFEGWSMGVSAARVSFPSGSIESTQLSLLVAIDQRFLLGRRTDHESSPRSSGFGFGEAAVYAGAYRWRRGAQGEMRYIGLRLMRPLEAAAAYNASVGLEIAGAASGNADGYAEGFVLASLHTPAIAGTELGIRAGIGLAGGGGVPTGGGAMTKLSVNLRSRIGQRMSVEIERGRMQRLNGPLDATFTSVAFGLQFSQLPTPEQRPALMGVSLQSYPQAQRKSGNSRPVNTMGFRIERSFDQATFFTGQAHTAVAGGAGGFGVGLVGLGRRIRVTPHWELGGEALVGAAGGGGVAVRGGAVTQAMLWARRNVSDRHQLHLAAGAIHAFNGELSSPSIEIGLMTAF